MRTVTFLVGVTATYGVRFDEAAQAVTYPHAFGLSVAGAKLHHRQ